MITTIEKNNAALIHLSGLAKYVFPFAGIIVPLLIWQSKRHESKYNDDHGKAAVNFNISMMVYTFILCLLFAIPIISLILDAVSRGEQFENAPPLGLLTSIIIIGIVFFIASLFEFILIILASVKASNGQAYKYPLTIKFIS